MAGTGTTAVPQLGSAAVESEVRATYTVMCGARDPVRAHRSVSWGRGSVRWVRTVVWEKLGTGSERASKRALQRRGWAGGALEVLSVSRLWCCCGDSLCDKGFALSLHVAKFGGLILSGKGVSCHSKFPCLQFST